ncbi:hypothetical protein OBBRIDRAFT_802469 [Obba rivulosa]|uniref:Uncharacterized protein n=1 Tax=Obba rivulosa TaxID=1052685 RepID=A0A8E2B4X9_9APHY|nr:hypothetical protein OBBRIDRAFT_802469 [Obba rivulosa]
MLPLSFFHALSALQGTGSQFLETAHNELCCDVHNRHQMDREPGWFGWFRVSNEVQFVWGRAWCSVNVLYYLNRWIALLWACLNVAVLLPMNSPRIPLAWSNILFEQGVGCVAVNDSFAICQALLQLIYPVSSAIRVYAVSNGNNILPGAVFLSGTAAAIMGIVRSFQLSSQVNSLATSIYQFDPAHSPTFAGSINCVQISRSSVAFAAQLYAAPACCVTAEAIVLSVTFFKSYVTTIRDARDHTEGILWFSSILMFNIFAMLAAVSSIPKYASLLTIPMNSVIISRFLLGLRKVASTLVEDPLEIKNPSFICSQHATQSIVSSIRFAYVVGNLGEPLRSRDDDDDSDLDWSYQHDETNDAQPEDSSATGVHNDRTSPDVGGSFDSIV